MPAPEEPSLPVLLYSLQVQLRFINCVYYFGHLIIAHAMLFSLQEHILGTFQLVLSSDLSYKDGRL